MFYNIGPRLDHLKRDGDPEICLVGHGMHNFLAHVLVIFFSIFNNFEEKNRFDALQDFQ
jgi:hypothetical protein